MSRLRPVCRLCGGELIRVHVDHRDRRPSRDVYCCTACNRTVDPPARCKSCGAIIVWLQHATTGKAAPIDVYPNPAGPVVRVGETGYRVLGPRETPEDGTQRFTNHFQTCPDAARHRPERGAPRS